jgi:8-oxo-dGTP diphosphatase
MQRYVVGFAFSRDKSQVLLIEKRRPQWQAGFLNGVGGKVEAEEGFPDAMVREFSEETGIGAGGEWRHFLTVIGHDYEMWVFATVADVLRARTCTDEPVHVVRVADVPNLPVLPNLRWMVPMALDTKIVGPVKIHVI